MWKSSQKWRVLRSAVRSIAWLNVWDDLNFDRLRETLRNALENFLLASVLHVVTNVLSADFGLGGVAVAASVANKWQIANVNAECFDAR